ncbi:MAG: aldehyde dehydrogenase [Treponema sp.]|nr:aldehyde dehydrogenase [Treponema sp.]
MDECSQLPALVEKQRAYFRSNATRSTAFRKAQLAKLYKLVAAEEERIAWALHADLGKSAYESYMAETGMVLGEIRYLMRHVGRWNRARRVKTALYNMPAKSYVVPEPYGVTLVMSPWNYPFMLTLVPLAASISAGNCVIVKPSRYSAHTSMLLKELINTAFDREYVTVVDGGHEMNSALLAQRFDFIFFTGSPAVGKVVMRAAAEQLTPVCLELGGKSPCIVEASADIRRAARRIVWGKLLNAGQTCIAPDYVLVEQPIYDALVAALRTEIAAQYGADPLKNPAFPHIINRKHFERLCALVPDIRSDEASYKIAPTVVPLSLNEAETAPVMQEEIFGPILPVISYCARTDAIAFIRSRATPLALYVFSADRAFQKALIGTVQSGGVCVNDVVTHIASHTLPFGGMGNYHGKYGFDTFSHHKAALFRSAVDVPIRYAPYPDSLRLLKLFEH